MSDLDAKASSLGRILTTWQVSANNGLPAVVLLTQLQIIHRVSGELIDEMKEVDPSTSVHVDSSLSDETSKLLSDYFQGHTTIPDTLEGFDG